MIRNCFNFDVMKTQYREYIDYFQDILEAAETSTESSVEKKPEHCFLIRVLLINRYRHILLGEPEIPPELIPSDCLGHRARDITEQLYKLICDPAEQYFMHLGESENGPLPAVNEEYYTRFGGISR